MRIGFDLDGTLITCRKKQLECLRTGVGGYAKTILWDDLWLAKRNGRNSADALRLQSVPEPVIASTLSFWIRNIESQAFLSKDKLFSGAVGTLQALKEGNSLFLISARKSEIALRAQISKLGLTSYFEKVEVVPGDHVAEAKADVFTELNLDCYIGDTELDWLAAKASGVTPFILSTGQRSECFLRERSIEPIYARLDLVTEALNAL
jgi:phosphoglycolate phosphatase-like HAD superfamily hydrolase